MRTLDEGHQALILGIVRDEALDCAPDLQSKRSATSQ